MKLIQFSFNNRFFIFFDEILEKLFVYELCIVILPDDESQFSKLNNAQNQKKEKYEFLLRYELKVSNSFLFKYLKLNNIDGLQYFIDNPSQIKIDDKSNVKMLYSENVGSHELYQDYGFEDLDQQMHYKLVGCIFKKDNNRCISTNSSFIEDFNFPLIA